METATMPNYNRLDIRPNDNANEYTFRCDGIDVGRCSLRIMSNKQKMWGWTMFTSIEAIALVRGLHTAGYAVTLANAQQQFRENFDRLMDSGKVDLTKATQSRRQK